MKLSKKKLQELKEKKISVEELNDKYFYTKKDGINAENALKLLNENLYSFEEIVDKFKSLKDGYNNSCLRGLLCNKEFFQELIKNNKLNIEDLKYLLNTIDEWYELRNLCRNTPVVKHILNEFVLNKELVDKFNTMIKNTYWDEENYKIHTIFEYIEYCNKNNEEILKLNELNKHVYYFNLTKDQKLELSELLKDSEMSKNRLIQIVDSNLESNYDFDSLKVYLKKQEKTSLLNI